MNYLFAAEDMGAAIRELQGPLPQAFVARRAEIDPSVWNLYYHGKRMPEQENVEKVARGLGVEPEVLLHTALRHYEQRRKRESRAAAQLVDPTSAAYGDDERDALIERKVREAVTRAFEQALQAVRSLPQR